MSVINTQPLIGASGNQVTGYNLTKSVRLRAAADAGFTKTYASSGSRTKQTFSFWAKFDYNSGAGYREFLYESTATYNFVNLYQYGGKLCYFGRDLVGGSIINYTLATDAVFRDPSAWYHIIYSIDYTQATAANRVKIYVNGVQYSLTATNDGFPPQNWNGYLNVGGYATLIGRSGGGDNYDGYFAEMNFIDGQQLTPSDFGENDATTNVWKPKRYTGTYGTNGFYLPFTDVATTSGSNAGLGKDFSGNGNYWNTTNISVTSGISYDSMLDVPTLTSASVANFAVLNPLDPKYGTLYDGNLYHQQPSGDYASARSTIGMKGGKWYWEVKCYATLGSGIYMACGIGDANDYSGYNYVGSTPNGYSYDGRALKVTNGASSSYGASYTLNDIIGVAFDADNGTLEFFKNGTSQGTAFTGINTALTYYAVHWVYSSGCIYNFGQQGFTYTPPSGFKALNTYNIPDSAIPAGNKVMDVTTWTGDGSTARAITNSGSFKPDAVWIKERDLFIAHTLYNSIVGGGINKNLYPNNTLDEAGGNTDATYGYLSSFNSDGFSIERGSNGSVSYTNKNAGTYVAWQWKAGQGTTSTNTSGSITSTVSVNPSAGFSIVTYAGNGVSGATIGHGLGVAPSFFIIKSRSGATNWTCYHQSLGNTYGIILNSTNAADPNTYWMNTSPTSTTFKVDSFGGLNASGSNYVAYCWAEIAGFSKFGSYTGNGSADGSFVYCGFRPKFIMRKRTDTTAYWVIYDTSRNPYNAANLDLYPNDASAEATGNDMDILSNGFKLRSAGSNMNASGGTYIYAAFAENPFKNSLAR